MKIHGNEETCKATYETWAAWLAAGEGMECLTSFAYLDKEVRQRFPQADVWYTERNGDGIGLLVPKGTAGLPRTACGYLVFEWIDPAKEFGSGVRVR